VGIRIGPYTTGWEPAVREFNARIRGKTGRAAFRLPESPVSTWLPDEAGRRVVQERYLATDDEGVVRGGYQVRLQDFWVGSRPERVANLQLPLAEGVADPRYRYVGVQIVNDATRRYARLYSLGMGGLDQPYPRLLRGMGWTLELVPFLFRIIRPRRFFARMPYLRRGRLRSLACDVLALSGAGWVGVRLAQAVAGRGSPAPPRSCRVHGAEAPGDWADAVWESSRADYTLVGLRDRAALGEILSEREFGKFHYVWVERDGRPIGWAAMRDTPMKAHHYFGDLRLGGLVDAFARPADAGIVARAATDYLAQRGVDLIVSNQAHPAWVAALRGSGYLAGPSNFALAASKGLVELAGPWDAKRPGFHFNRGDGDGPINI
jgi:hypothetical protein